MLKNRTMKKRALLFAKERFWIGRTFLLFATIIFLFLNSTCGQSKDADMNVGGLFCMGPDDAADKHGNWGAPHKLDLTLVPVTDSVKVTNNDKYIAFGIIADTHVDALTCADSPLLCPNFDYYNDSDWMKNNRNVINDLNLDCKKTGRPFVDAVVKQDCLGIVHLGDMVNDRSTQQLVAFRQLYEYDYSHKDVYTWGCDCGTRCNDAYSQGFRIHFPVIPVLGNHDVTHSYRDQNTETGGILYSVSLMQKVC